MQYLLLATVAALLVPPTYAQEPAPGPSPGEIAAAAPASDWVAIAASDLMVLDLAPDAQGQARRVVIQLMPAPLSQGWINNIRKLAAAHWWDGTSVNRVQDNYVVQWGDATEKKALPAGLVVVPESDYVTPGGVGGWQRFAKLLIPNGGVERYASFEKGWPVAAERTPDSVRRWPVHCYGMVGVGRNMSPDTGSGAELYTVIGHAPRHLDRNIALVGRVISGIEYLSSLPRGTEELGFYKTDAERTPIISIRIASELPAAKQPRFEYLSTESDSFARYADARANRRDPFFIKPAGGTDICNIPVPVRPVAAK
ncbi:peptidylprolyl isomerase [Sphingopyxis sp. JAI128]|uniref:peptidylprolyl isomerase n=1 Tax=Sphingopyxis sp. JAI128 TaxID=2723066 RepID=UPI00161B850F|nr:peptidylprolyl isomerase [Sphingopyxis sp. JAI128]MBB6424370.1 peptidylprolyl isomerase [Sphingopyxis sp. JAI128]